MNLQRLSRARAHYEKGMEHLSGRRYKSATSSLARAVRLDRDNAEYRYLRGLAHFHLDQHDRAILDFRAAVARDSGHARAYTCLASTYVATAEYELAAERYEEAIKADPAYAAAYAGLRMMRSFLGDSRGADKEVDDATSGRIDALLRHVSAVVAEGAAGP